MNAEEILSFYFTTFVISEVAEEFYFSLYASCKFLPNLVYLF
jgi:hypothetical protein